MDQQTKVFLRSKIKEGKGPDEARRDLISYGYETTDFNENYLQIAKELGVESPAFESKKKEPEPDYSVEENTEVVIPGVGEVLKNCFVKTFRNFSAVLAATVLMSLLTLVGFFVPSEPNAYLFGISFFVVWLMIGLVYLAISITVSMALFYAIVNSETEEGFLHGVQWSMQNIFPILGISVIITCIFISGLVGLVLPGLIFLVYSSLSFVVLAKGNHSGVLAVVRSTDLVADNFWSVLTRLVVVAFVGFLITLPASILLSMATTLNSDNDALLYIATVVSIFSQMFVLAIFSSALSDIYDACARAKRLFDISIYRVIKWVYRIMVLFGLIIIGGVVALNMGTISYYFNTNFSLDANTIYQLRSERAGGTESELDDYILRVRLDEGYSSAQFYTNRIGFVEGVCEDAVIEEGVKCRNTDEAFMLYAELTNGKYYCRDSSGFRGTIDNLSNTASCEPAS